MEQPFDFSTEHVTDKKRTAIHEAGHAVMCLICRSRAWVNVESVTIIPTSSNEEATAGSMEYYFELKGDGADDKTSEVVLKSSTRALISVAGIVAEQIASYPKRDDFGFWNDLCQYDEMVSELSETLDDYDNLHSGGFARAEVMLRQRWNAVEAIADALMDKGRIDGVEALLLYVGASEGQVPAIERTNNGESFAVTFRKADSVLEVLKISCKHLRLSFRKAVQARTAAAIDLIVNNDLYSDSDKVESIRNWLAAVDSALDE